MLSSASYEKWLEQQIQSGLLNLEFLQAQLSLALSLPEQYHSSLTRLLESIQDTVNTMSDELEAIRKTL